MAVTRPVWLATLLVVAGCSGSDGSEGDPAPDAGPEDDRDAAPEPDPDPEVDDSDLLFEADRVLEVAIEMAPGDWDELRHQTRDVFTMLEGEDCLAEPFGSPFTYFEATVAVDGETRARAGVRKKGLLGSLSEDRPSLKIDFEEYVQDNELHALEKMTLNNAISDPALVRQCLSYSLFAQAGVPAPRCNFARVSVNGQDLGVYVHLESVGKRFLARHYDDPEGNLYEGSLSDFRDGWVGSFEQKTNETEDPSRVDLEAVTRSLDAPDEELASSLAGVVDVDQFTTFWAMEILAAHVDGYSANANNFFAYADPATGRFSFFPWGTDATFWAVDPFGPGHASVWATGVLAYRLYQNRDTRAAYHARLRELLDTVWHEDAIVAEIDRMEDLLLGHVDAAGQPDFRRAVEEVRNYVRGRRAAILGEIDDGVGPEWELPLRDAPCMVHVGSADGTFEAVWGTAGAEDPFAVGGAGTIEAEIDAAALEVGTVTATAGWDPEGSGHALVQVIAALDDGRVIVAHFAVDPAVFVGGLEIDLDITQNVGALVWFDPASGEWGVWGYFFGGRLRLDQASLVEGEPVRGSFQSDVIEFGF